MIKYWHGLIDTLKMFGMVFAGMEVYAFVCDQEYHEMFDKISPIKYNCDMLVGGWHPDVPTKVLEECRKKYIIQNQERI